MKSTFTKICMFAIKADNLQLVKRVVALPPYRREDELNALIKTANRDLTAKDFRDAGFDEFVDGDEANVSGVSYSKMGDDAKCYIYRGDFLLIDEHVARIRAKDIIEDEHYKDIFEFCVDDDKGTYSRHREENILKEKIIIFCF